jgi:hypothetical protein
MNGRVLRAVWWCSAWLAISGALGCTSMHLNGLGGSNLDRSGKELQVQGPPAPAKYQFAVSPFVFHSDFELKRDLPLFKELATLRDQVCKELKLPSGNAPVKVYVFEDRDRYERFMQAKYPDLPKRRAFFVAQPRTVGGTEDLLVYTYWGERIQEDLRHELTHALLHSVLKDVPLWLDEGLAEYFEVAPESKGINPHHLDHIKKAAFVPFQADLTRLEQLSQVQQMTPAEYREAWAWVHLMLKDKPEAKAVLTNYLQQLRSNANPGPLGPRLAAVYPAPNDALKQHLARLESANSFPGAPGGLRIQ